MKQTKQKNDNLIYRGRNINEVQTVRGSYASLDNYSRSPYLQRFNLQNNLRGKKIQKQLDKGNQKQDKILHLQNHNRSVSSTEQHHQLTIKKANKLKLPKLDLQDNTLNNVSTNQKFTNGSLSATLQINPKKKKLLQPIKSVYKMHSLLRTKAGSNGKQVKINQDIGIIQNKLPFGLKMYCVCDGHGTNGHLVSTFIKTNLIKNLTNALKKVIHQPENIQQIINNSLYKTNQMLLDSQINTQLSGSTVIAVFIYQNKLYCFNVGDSRAILIQSQNQQWNIKQLSIDQKPSRQDQKDRIIKAGGRVQCQKDQQGEDIGPLRVWMKEVQMPGLAMTRSFGDKAGIKAGTNGDPQLIMHELTPNDKLLIIASDGVWQYLENNQVMNILLPYYLKDQLEQGIDRLVKISVEIWQKVSFSRDDITAIIVGLNGIDNK